MKNESVMSKSEQKRVERKQKKKRAHDQRKHEWELRRRTSTSQAKVESIWPTFEVICIDQVSDRVIEAVNSAWKRAALSKELQGEMLVDLQKANKFGFLQSRYRPIGWSMIFGRLIYSELQKILEPVILRRIDVEVHAPVQNFNPVLLKVRELDFVEPFVACSPKQPKIRIGDEEFVVAFNLRDDDHFVRRLEERTVVDSSAYICKGQVFACLYNWQHFEVFELPNGQLATRLWNWCDPRTPLGPLWKELLGDEVELTDYGPLQFFDSKLGRAYYLVGYCPISEKYFSRGFAVLNTLLIPGMGNTPEASVIQRGMSTTERYAFDKQAARQSMRELSIQKEFSFVRQCHRHVPQVKIISEDVFSYGTL